MSPTNPPHAPTPHDPGPPANAPYEFSTSDNLVMARLASKMHFVGLFVIGIGVVAAAFGALRFNPGAAIVCGLCGVLYVVVGVWTARAGSSFRRVAVTHGQDISNLMSALDDLRKLFTLQYWVCLILLASALVLLTTTALGGSR